MSKLNATITVDRPPAEVFAVLTDFDRWPRWQGGLERMEQVGPGPLQVGSRLRQVRTGQKATDSLMEVTELVPGKVLALSSPGRPIGWHGTFTLEPVGNSSRMTAQFEIQAAGLAGALAEAIIRLTVGRELRLFRALVEAG